MSRQARGLQVGARTYLRALGAQDEERFLALVRSSKGLHRGWVSPPATPKAFRQYIARSRKRDMRTFLVCSLDGDTIVGVVQLSQIFRGGFKSAYLGFFAFAPLAGRGYMTEGLQLAVGHAFGPMRLHRVEANIQPPNERSIALVKRCGFRLEGFSPRYVKVGGRWRDHERWAILAEETRGSRPA